jgi:NitT/TauT family transport system permease protein
VALALWEIASRSVSNPILLPSLGSIASALRDLSASARFWDAFLESLVIVLEGLSLAIVTGIVIGVAMGHLEALEYGLDPYVNVLNATPRVTFIPLIVLWFGLGPTARVVVVFILAVLPMIVNTYYGMKNVDPDYRELARSYCATRLQELRDISIPSAVPFILSGIRLGVGYAISGVVTAELLLSFAGLGGLLIENSNLMVTRNVYAIVAVFAIWGIVFNSGARMLERRLLRGRGVDV